MIFLKAEIMAIGTEILLGDIVNTNAQFLARELANLGIGVYHQSVVGILRYLSETISRVMAELMRKLALKGMNMRLVSV